MPGRAVTLALAALLAGCTHYGCESLDMHSLDSPEDFVVAVDCYRSFTFDWVLGHKLPGER